ncbi:FAD-dependent thymidylate synthase [Aureimonas sp. N4]|uniref:FAD-dependent thymidylate synthase n=1 Tax=Aureimonas sp. N4 TaxID=1638165 RepID=UPI0007862F64|nr:FAD-dependent thymidylate synthase [Aureimonas sp. N4]
MNTVRLVAATQPLVPECETGGDFVAYAARVSNPSNQANRETAPRLLEYLKRHKHWSPYEHASATVEATTTLDIAMQVLRHRSAKFQQFSLRYAEAIGFVYRQARRQDEKNRQNSIDDLPSSTHRWWRMAQWVVMKASAWAYRGALKRGIAKECARCVLPYGNTETRMYITNDYRSWLHYLDVREEAGTQQEHRELANAIRAALAEREPLIFGEGA